MKQDSRIILHKYSYHAENCAGLENLTPKAYLQFLNFWSEILYFQS